MRRKAAYADRSCRSPPDFVNATSIIAHSSNNSAGLSQADIAELNRAYAPLHFNERLQRLYRDFAPDKVMVTSSFAATSAYFLHIISRIRPEQEVLFINTGYHFPETLAYRDELAERYHLRVRDLVPDEYQHQYSEDEKLYQTDPDFCCTINKVNPLEAVKVHYHVWVSSLMGWQTDHRAGLAIFEERRGHRLFALHGERRRPQRPLAGQTQDRVRPAPVALAGNRFHPASVLADNPALIPLRMADAWLFCTTA